MKQQSSHREREAVFKHRLPLLHKDQHGLCPWCGEPAWLAGTQPTGAPGKRAALGKARP